MDVRDCRTVRLPSSISRRLAERRPGSIGHITLRGKCAGARSAGKPHAACDVAGALCANILETIRSLKLVSRAEEDHR